MYYEKCGNIGENLNIFEFTNIAKTDKNILFQYQKMELTIKQIYCQFVEVVIAVNKIKISSNGTKVKNFIAKKEYVK